MTEKMGDNHTLGLALGAGAVHLEIRHVFKEYDIQPYEIGKMSSPG